MAVTLLRRVTRAARGIGPHRRRWSARATAPIRLLPDFLIIGAMRSGTTSLYQYLCDHPRIRAAMNKEVHFFDFNFHRGKRWYQSKFPTIFHKAYIRRVHGWDLLTGEATPYYVFHPHAARRARQLLPGAKVIVLLRNPVDRAYSHYRLIVHRGSEDLSFEEAIDREPERLRGELERMLDDEFYYSDSHRSYSYLSRGIYVDQLHRWMEFFPREQFLILRSEDFFQDPETTYNRVLSFLELPPHHLMAYRQHGILADSKMPPPVRERLIDYFAPHNRRLAEFLRMDFGWDR